jgi:hypothetical protein
VGFGREVHSLRVATLKKVLAASLGAVAGFLLGALVWYVVLEGIGVDGLTRYVDDSPERSYLWEAVLIYAGPAFGLLAGSAIGWRFEAGTQRAERSRPRP